MIAAPAPTTTARKRPKRTRARNFSARPALALSTVDPHRMDLDHPTTPSLVCPDCDTWCPITPVRGTAMSVLVPHHTEGVGSPDPRRCHGSHRLLDLDLVVFPAALAAWERHLAESAPAMSGCDTRALHKAKARAARRARTPEPAHRAYTAHRAQCATCTDTTYCPTARPLAGALHLALTAAAWRLRLAEAIPSAGSRRSTKVLPKPVVPTAPAVMHVLPVPSVEKARSTYEAHRWRCAACTGTAHCIDGARLAALTARLRHEEPQRKQVREKTAKQDAEFAKHQARMFPERRAAEWAAVLPAVDRVDKEQARLHNLAKAQAPTAGLEVPRETLRPQR
ncbi:hypothetical protein [Embleya sp. NPDC050493]|uniref:hypothetical protein n=1 Tax=Embleya sp. NPDC050493 TaxID=3363989 RepID=UPI00378C042F